MSYMPHSDLVERLRESADLCVSETATDFAELLDEAAWSITNLLHHCANLEQAERRGERLYTKGEVEAIVSHGWPQEPPPALRHGPDGTYPLPYLVFGGWAAGSDPPHVEEATGGLGGPNLPPEPKP